MKKSTLLLVALAAAGVVSIAQAVPVQVATRAALGANDFKDWATLGPSGTNLTNPFTTTSNGGLSFTESQAAHFSMRANQGNGWNGNFAPGDALIFTDGPFGPITIDFATAILGVGFQIQANDIGAFTATLTPFDAMGNMLGGPFSIAGTASIITTGDNTAPFLGILDNVAEISRIVVDVDSFGQFNSDHNFAINLMSIRTAPAASVPEGGTSGLLLGLASVGLFLGQRYARGRASG
jgi:hypothetical protein